MTTRLNGRDLDSARRYQRLVLGADVVVTTGLVLQELLQGFSGPKASARIVERFAALPLVQPTREDHVAAAQLRNTCRRSGIQVGTINALIAQLCIRHELTLLSTDKDFDSIAKHCPLSVVHRDGPDEGRLPRSSDNEVPELRRGKAGTRNP